MKIKSVDEVTQTFHYVETDEKPFGTYRRWSAENYELLMGESWEAWYCCDELEKLFQECGLVAKLVETRQI